jgi:hypothetical protein
MTWGESAKTISMLAGMSSMGLGDLNDLTKQATTMVNSLGVSGPKAARTLQDVAVEAVALNNEIGGKMGSVIQMDDFFEITGRLAEGVDALAVNHKGLAKAMRLSLKMGASSIKAYDRRKIAAENLTRAMSSGVDQGFRTMHAQEELNILLRSSEYGKDAANIRKMWDNKLIHAGQVAEMIQKLTGGTDEGILIARFERAATALGEGNLALAQSEFGEGLGLDESTMLLELHKARESGKTTQEFLAADTKESKAARKQLLGMQETVAKRRTTGAKNLTEATIDEFMTEMQPVFAKTLSVLVELLTNLVKAIKEMRDMWENSTLFGGSKGKAAREKARKEEEAGIKKGRNLLSTRLTALTGENIDSPRQAVEMLMRDKDLQAKYFDKFRKQKIMTPEISSAIKAMYGGEQAADLTHSISKSGRAAATAKRRRELELQSQLKANGEVVTVVKDKSLSKNAKKMSNIRAGKAKATGPRTPTP